MVAMIYPCGICGAEMEGDPCCYLDGYWYCPGCMRKAIALLKEAKG